MHHAAAREIHEAVTEGQAREPTATPGPICEDRVDQARGDQCVDHEGAEFPAFRERTGRNGEGGAHQCHVKEEQGKGWDVVRRTGQTETARTEQTVQ